VRARIVAPAELGLGGLGPEMGAEALASWESLVARASDAELERLHRMLESERARRVSPSSP
jgi:hypothetical protein